MRCNILMTGFVNKTLRKAHAVLVSRLLARSEHVEDVLYAQRFPTAIITSQQGPSTYSISDSQNSIPPHVTREEDQHADPPSYRPFAEAPLVHELGQATPPAELYSDPGFDNPKSRDISSNNSRYIYTHLHSTGFLNRRLYNYALDDSELDSPVFDK